jgi:hypothetical protein
MSSKLSYELILALLTMILLTAIYVVLSQEGVPAAGSVVGHVLGITGFLMMLSTETLYSLRKRLPRFTYGRMSLWLQAHIFTGIVGPFLVLLHSGWKFNGLAGILTLLTILVVLSGIIGRYIYTAVPRDLDGVELAIYDIEAKLNRAEQKLEQMGMNELGSAVRAAATEAPGHGWLLVLGRPYYRWQQKRHLRDAILKLDAKGQSRAAQLETLLEERQRLQMEIRLMEVARRVLALWYVFHLPLSAALFTLAFFHIGGAMYFATFLR